MSRKRAKKRPSVIKRVLPAAYEAMEMRRQNRAAREAADAEAKAAFERDRPFEAAVQRIYGPMAMFGPHLLVLAAAGYPEALDAVNEIDPAIAPATLEEIGRRRAAMAAYFTDPRVDPDGAFFLDEIGDELRERILGVLPEAVAASVEDMRSEYGWTLGVAPSGWVFPTG